jgi:hypothetical protein
MDTLIVYAPALAVSLVAIGLFLYGLALLGVFLPKPPINGQERRWYHAVGEMLRAWFSGATAQNLGIPCAAISAFAIVTVLWSRFPPTSNATDPFSLKAFGLEFNGPSGPITLWLLCFLGFVVALKLLRTGSK